METYGIDDIHTHIAVLTTIKTIAAKSSPEVPEFVNKHEIVLARARSTNFPLISPANKSTSTEDCKTARTLHTIYSWEILSRLPDEPEWDTFRRSIKERVDCD